MSKKAYITPYLALTIMSTSDILTESGDGFEGPSQGFFDDIEDVIHVPEDWFKA